MSNFDALTGTGTYAREAGGAQAAPAALVEAIVATTAAGVDDEVMALIGAESSQLRVGPCRWMPRAAVGGPLLPTRGDPCLVATSDKGHRVLVWWAPA